MTFRVQPAVITRICDGCRTESDPVDCPELLDQGWTLAPGTPYDHPVTALDWCPNCTTIRSDLAAAIQRVRDVCEQDSFWINHAKTGGWGKALTVAQVLAALGPATYSHIEDTVTIYSCEHHCCSACTALDGGAE